MSASQIFPQYRVEPFDPDQRRFDGYKIPSTDRHIPVAIEPWPYRNEAVRALYSLSTHGLDEQDRERKLRVKEYKAAHFDFFCASEEEQATGWMVRDDGRIVRRWH